MEFHETRGGHEFYFGTMPRVAKALEKIAENLEKREQKESPLTKEKVLAAQRVLMDNGIEPDETGIVMQALGCVLFDAELEDMIWWDSKEIPYTNSIWEQPNPTTTDGQADTAKPETTSGTSRDRAIELLNDVINDVMVGNNISDGIETLVSNYGFTGEELVADFGFDKQDVEDAIGGEVTDLRTWTAETEAERRAKI